MSSLLITSRCAIRGRSELHFLGQPHVTVVSHRTHIRLFALTRGSQETGHAAIACNCDDGLKRNAPPLRSIYEQMTTSNLVSKAISSGTWALLHRSRSPVQDSGRYRRALAGQCRGRLVLGSSTTYRALTTIWQLPCLRHPLTEVAVVRSRCPPLQRRWVRRCLWQFLRVHRRIVAQN